MADSAPMTALSELSSALQARVVQYQLWLKSRPQQGADLEVVLKWLSYYLAGRTESRVSAVSELAYCVSRLLGFCNRLLVSAPAGRPRLPDAVGAKLRAWLSLLEYTEVFLELAASQLLGPAARWVVIVIVQLVKTCLRLVLLYSRGSGMLVSPPLPPDSPEGCAAAVASLEQDQVVVLPSTGRRLRSVHTVASPTRRAWGVPRAAPPSGPPRPLEGRRLAAETLHVLQPVVQLVGVAAAGYTSWPAWLLPLATDLASLHLHTSAAGGDESHLSAAERTELYSRRLQLALYLLRSPFYERHTRERLVAALGAVSRHVPLGRFLAQPLLDYLPAWQRVFFYVW